MPAAGTALPDAANPGRRPGSRQMWRRGVRRDKGSRGPPHRRRTGIGLAEGLLCPHGWRAPPAQDDTPDQPETAEARRLRIAREAVLIAEARAELDAGFYVDSDEIDVWIDSIGTANELPPPPTRHR